MKNYIQTLNEFINEQEINEKLSWANYLKELGIDQKIFKKMYPDEHEYFKKQYMSSSEASEFEQDNYDDLLRITNAF